MRNHTPRLNTHEDCAHLMNFLAKKRPNVYDFGGEKMHNVDEFVVKKRCPMSMNLMVINLSIKIDLDLL